MSMIVLTTKLLKGACCLRCHGSFSCPRCTGSYQLGFESEQKGAYIYFPCRCGDKKVIKAFGEKKNIYYCPKCKDIMGGNNLGKLLMKVRDLYAQQDLNNW